jgi:pimeloyl-ACP methyl ester carboxylesterase
MSNTKTVHVDHLGGIDAGYQMPYPYDPSKPTLILVNSFTTSSELYRGQYANRKLTDKMNLLAIELLGHGKTRTKSENFTYWDTAIMNLQVMEALGVKKAFVLGTSQGGWITVRMALLAPDRVGNTTNGGETDDGLGTHQDQIRGKPLLHAFQTLMHPRIDHLKC